MSKKSAMIHRDYHRELSQIIPFLTYVYDVVLVPVGQVELGVVYWQAEQLPFVVGAGDHRVLDLGPAHAVFQDLVDNQSIDQERPIHFAGC